MYNPMRLDNQRIMVTGASSGLGRACAHVISRLGGEVVLVARDRSRLEETLSAMEGSGHQLEPYDLSQVEAIPKWIKEVVARGEKPLTGLVHCAGVEITLPIRTMKIADYERMMNINVTAAFSLAKGFRQRGVCQTPAAIVLISSVGAIKAGPAMAAYATGKSALIGMAKSLAVELAREQIRVNVLTPGLVRTEMSEQMGGKRTESQIDALVKEHLLGMGTAEDIANSAAFLLAKTGRWITGSNLVIDGGYSIH